MHTAPPTITGPSGQVLTAGNGTWASVGSITYTYQWQVSPTGADNDWTSATGAGADTASYTLSSTDYGQYVRVMVTATNSGGSGTATSSATGPDRRPIPT